MLRRVETVKVSTYGTDVVFAVFALDNPNMYVEPAGLAALLARLSGYR